jgi:hypothetical protein
VSDAVPLAGGLLALVRAFDHDRLVQPDRLGQVRPEHHGRLARQAGDPLALAAHP